MSIDFEIVREKITWGGRPLTLETGKVARQADGAVLATLGESVVLCTVVCAKEPKAGIDFFPLSVHYLEKTYAVGRIPGGFLKRESKPSDLETLTSRLIDRPIRPLFPDNFFNEVQIVCTVLSHDGESDLEVLSLIGASAALSISGAPFQGPVAASRVGFIDDKFVLNPTPDQLKNSALDLVVAGTHEGVLMVESEAKELTEDQMLEAVTFGHEAFEPVLKLITKFKKKAGKKEIKINDLSKEEADWIKKIQKFCGKDLKKAFAIKDKQERYAKRRDIEKKVKEHFVEEITDELLFNAALKKCEADILRTDILKNSKRIDGRDLTTVRPIVCETGILPQTHGSSLFTRGETQVLAVTTLGTAQDEQIMDSLAGEYRERFMLHYNFPSYSVGETGRVGAPGRREIGHGRLAWRALRPMMPSKEAFPYTVRSVAEVTESNGSSSMATVCSTSMALMEAGVPLEKPVAGIAMGLIKEGKNYAVLSDILGDEDHLGDMDFKVAGTQDGVTALQMDIKITSITPEIMKQALDQAKEGRLHILSIMNDVINTPKSSVSQHAPKMQTISIPKDKIRDLIGPGGKVIREICETTGAKIDIEEDGSVTVSAVKEEALAAAIDAIKGITCPPEVGAIYTGKVVKIAEFGAFVNFMGSKDGLVHISEISQERIAKVSDVLKVGQEVKVKVIGFDDRGKIKLSMKQ